MSDDTGEDEVSPGAPLWMATFADLMSLLMCFFVLILSFSEMDLIKYKKLAGSMQDAFGVQRTVNTSDIPKGTSIVAKEFSPGKPDPTIINSVQQQTINQDLRTLSQGNPDIKKSDAETVKNLLSEKIQRLTEETKDNSDMLRELLRREIEAGQIDVESENRTIIVRIREKGSFPSGSAILNASFINVLSKTGGALNQTEGEIFIKGHTDNVPISNTAYGSNWDLSAARAVAVAEQLLATSQLDHKRLTVSGHADTRPKTSNDSKNGREKNRRVEIIIKQALEE